MSRDRKQTTLPPMRVPTITIPLGEYHRLVMIEGQMEAIRNLVTAKGDNSPYLCDVGDILGIVRRQGHELI